MKEEQIREKYGIGKKLGIALNVHLVLMVAAFAITVIGILRNTNLQRTIIYGGQAIACLLIVFFGVLRFADRDRKNLKIVLNAYALLEAFRAALLNTTGIHPAVAVISRFILAILACTCILVAERMDKRSGERVAILMVLLEFVLYLIFLLGFPGVLLGRMNRFLPLVGVFIAGSIALLQKSKNVQLGIGEEAGGKTAPGEQSEADKA